jgi:rubrerythrin
MEPTTIGPNRTGAARDPKGIDLMLEAVANLSPLMPISTLRMDVERQRYITEAESVGSIAPPIMRATKPKANAKRAATAVDPGMQILLDKLGERIAFERTGTRLYSALITKYLALKNAGDALLALQQVSGAAVAGETNGANGDATLQTLQRIRMEELQHFRMLCDLVTELGGDPTVQTPCADVTAAASMGLMQVLTDPRTTIAQCLNTLLTAELTDNAGWELLSELADSAGQPQLLERFAEALQAEQQHLAIVRDWLRALTTQARGTAAV